jgi:peptidoglycan/LPS O-acetylase OafA/YrhL
MWWGVAAAQWLLLHRWALISGDIAPALRWLAWLGTWSLTWYMLHQPVMIGVMTVLKKLGA